MQFGQCEAGPRSRPHRFSEFPRSGLVIAAGARPLKVLLEESSHSAPLLLALELLPLTYTCLFSRTLAVRLGDLHVCGHQLHRRDVLERVLGSQRYSGAYFFARVG